MTPLSKTAAFSLGNWGAAVGTLMDASARYGALNKGTQSWIASAVRP